MGIPKLRLEFHVLDQTQTKVPHLASLELKAFVEMLKYVLKNRNNPYILHQVRVCLGSKWAHKSNLSLGLFRGKI